MVSSQLALYNSNVPPHFVTLSLQRCAWALNSGLSEYKADALTTEPSTGKGVREVTLTSLIVGKINNIPSATTALEHH